MKRPAFLALLPLLLALPVSAQAQAKATAAPKISAATILDKYVEATGGKAAYNKITSTVMQGKITVTAQNLNGTVVVMTKAPNRFYTAQTFENIGKTEVAYNGKTGWSKDPFQGLRDLSPKELTQTANDAVFNGPVKWREIYKKAEVIGIRKVEGKDAYAVRLTPKVGKPSVQYYDTKTFLLVRSDNVQESPQGTIPVESYLSDYRAVNGVKTAFKVRSRIGASELVTEITELKNNVPVDDKVFIKPAQ